MKDMRNNFGVKGVTKPDASFFKDLKKPVDSTWAKKAHKVFEGATPEEVANTVLLLTSEAGRGFHSQAVKVFHSRLEV